MQRISGFLFAGLILIAAPTVTRAGVMTGFDAMTSTVFEEGQSSFSGIGLRAHLHPASLVPQVEFLPTFEYWRNSSTVQPYNIQAIRKDATLGVDARYVFTKPTWKPYLGAGFAIHFLSNKVNAPAFGLNDASTSVTKGGLAALAGASFPLTGRIETFVDLKYHHITDYRQLKLSWGLAFGL